MALPAGTEGLPAPASFSLLSTTASRFLLQYDNCQQLGRFPKTLPLVHAAFSSRPKLTSGRPGPQAQGILLSHVNGTNYNASQ